MTIGIAAKYDGGVLLGSDSLVSVGSQRIYLPEIKAFSWHGCCCLYAGSLDWVQRFHARGHVVTGFDYGCVEAIQASLWETPLPKKERSAFELVVADRGHNLFIVSGHGEIVPQADYAVTGSELAWVGLDLEYPKVRKRTLAATKTMMARVLRSVCKRDSTCDGPFFYWNIT